MAYTHYDPTIHTPDSLTQALIVNGTGISLVPGAIDLKYGTYSSSDDAGTSISFYDGALPLNIGAGLLLTSGDGSPSDSNTTSNYTRSFDNMSEYGNDIDPQLQAIATAAFSGAGQIRDASILTFQIQVSDPGVKSVRFDLVFGSDEYPEYANSSYVDIGAVLVNDANYALFNNAADQPLSVTKTNLTAGNFYNNTTLSYDYFIGDPVTLPIEYDGVSKPLTVIAPVQQGINTIKVGVADTGDKAYDSGLFVSNVQGVGYTGGGLAQVVEVTEGSLDDPIEIESGTLVYEVPATVPFSSFSFGADDTGDKTIIGNAASYIETYFDYSVADLLNAFYDPFSALSQTNALTLLTPQGQQSLVGADLVLFKDGAYALDTMPGGKTWEAYSLIDTAFGAGPDKALLSEWVKIAQDSADFTALADAFLDKYAPEGFTTQDLITHLLGVFNGVTPSEALINEAMSLISSQGLDSDAEILAFAAENLFDSTGFSGSIQELDPSFFL